MAPRASVARRLSTILAMVSLGACAAPVESSTSATSAIETNVRAPADDAYCDAPRGVAEPSFERTPNVQASSFSLFLSAPPSKRDAIARLGAIDVAQVACSRRIDRSRASMGGETVTTTLTSSDPRYLLGSFGAGPCIGVLVLGPIADGKRAAWSFHFTATDDPGATLAAARLPDGAVAAVFGGDSSSASNTTLAGVTKYLASRAPRASTSELAPADEGTPIINAGIRVLGFSDTEGLWIDYDANLRRFRLDLPSSVSR